MGGLPSWFGGVVVEAVIGTVAIYLLLRLKAEHGLKLRYYGRLLRARLPRSTPVTLVWIDADAQAAWGIVAELRERGVEGRWRVLQRPSQLLEYPLRPAVVRAIIMLDSDVTKIAEDAGRRRELEGRIHRYVDRGGALIATHDILYRRVGCTILQEMFGLGDGGLDAFSPRRGTAGDRLEGPVTYDVVPERSDHRLARGLPESFVLHDGEVMYRRAGWPRVRPVFVDAESGSPMVVAHEHATSPKAPNGRLVWLNSGDQGTDDLSLSLRQPEPHFVQLLENSLAWVCEER